MIRAYRILLVFLCATLLGNVALANQKIALSPNMSVPFDIKSNETLEFENFLLWGLSGKCEINKVGSLHPSESLEPVILTTQNTTRSSKIDPIIVHVELAQNESVDIDVRKKYSVDMKLPASASFKLVNNAPHVMSGTCYN